MTLVAGAFLAMALTIGAPQDSLVLAQALGGSCVRDGETRLSTIPAERLLICRGGTWQPATSGAVTGADRATIDTLMQSKAPGAPCSAGSGEAIALSAAGEILVCRAGSWSAP